MRRIYKYNQIKCIKVQITLLKTCTIWALSNSPTLKLCLPSSKSRSKNNYPHGASTIFKKNVMQISQVQVQVRFIILSIVNEALRCLTIPKSFSCLMNITNHLTKKEWNIIHSKTLIFGGVYKGNHTHCSIMI